MMDSWGVSIAAALFYSGHSMNTHEKTHLMKAKEILAKVAANYANYVHFATTNKAALPDIDENDRKNPAVYPSEAVMKRSEFSEAFDGEQLTLREEIWEFVKAR